MTDYGGGGFEHRRLRAPSQNGGAVIDPPLDAVAAMVRENTARAQRTDYDCQGRGVTELADEARASLVRLAYRYTSAYRDVAEADPLDATVDRPVFLSGHQPQLFHPGVWLKNFALSELARRHRAIGIHLIIDNDLARRTTMAAPGGSMGEPSVQQVPFDVDSDAVPYERRRIVDRELFRSFASRVEAAMIPAVPTGLMRDFWPLAVEAMDATDNLGQCLCRARHRIEGQWGAATLEVPLSHICSQRPFYRFASHIFAQLPRFRDVYNTSLAQYRREARIRSRTHPVPDLIVDDDFHEAPFWVFTADDPRRRRLFARTVGSCTTLSDRAGFQVDLELSGDADATMAVEQLQQLSDSGVAVRPRALMTTLFARLFLGDLFLHGIGGAKYDQLTDLLISRFFGCEPPGFLVISGTMHLDCPRSPIARDDLRETNRMLRQLRYHPERFTENRPGDSPDAAVVDELAATKRRWIETKLPYGQRRPRHEAIVRVNEALQPFVAEKRGQLLAQQRQLSIAMQNEAVFASREYAFCLFPQETLRPWFTDVLRG